MLKLRVSEWCCAVRINENTDVSLLHEHTTPFTVIKDSYRYWTADPFLFKKDGEYYLFFEMFDRLKRKGLLGCRPISDGKAGRMEIIYECDCHLSYPFIYEENNEIYIIPESSNGNELFRLRCIEFPTKWEKELVYTKDRLVDTTLFHYDNTKYFLSERVLTTGEFDRLDLFYEEDGRFIECETNPQKSDYGTARGAGKIFKKGNDFIRPSQDCGKFYGEKLNFNKIIEISKNGYKEETIETISIRDINLDTKNSFVGIHTYNKLDNIEVIDLKIGKNFNILNLIGALIKRIGGYKS